MRGRRLVREWDPESDLKRTWHETMDWKNNIRNVFDKEGHFESVR